MTVLASPTPSKQLGRMRKVKVCSPIERDRGVKLGGKAKLEKDHSKKSVENQDTPTFARFYLFAEGPEGQRRAEKVLLRDLLVYLASSGFPAMREDEVIKSYKGGAGLLRTGTRKFSPPHAKTWFPFQLLPLLCLFLAFCIFRFCCIPSAKEDSFPHFSSPTPPPLPPSLELPSCQPTWVAFACHSHFLSLLPSFHPPYFPPPPTPFLLL